MSRRERRRQAKQDRKGGSNGQTRGMVVRRKVSRKIGGKWYTFSALTMGDWQYLASMAFDNYKSETLKMITDNAESIRAVGGDPQQVLLDKLAELQDLSVNDLPSRKVELAMQANDGTTIYHDDGVTPRMIRQVVPYHVWYASSTTSGVIQCIWRCLLPDHPEVTLDEVETLATNKEYEDDWHQAAQEIGRLSESQIAKNSEAPASPGTTKAETIPATTEQTTN